MAWFLITSSNLSKVPFALLDVGWSPAHRAISCMVHTVLVSRSHNGAPGASGPPSHIWPRPMPPPPPPQAAWGALQKNSTQLFIRSYELGVLVTPSLERAYRASRWRGFSCTSATPFPPPAGRHLLIVWGLCHRCLWFGFGAAGQFVTAAPRLTRVAAQSPQATRRM